MKRAEQLQFCHRAQMQQANRVEGLKARAAESKSQSRGIGGHILHLPRPDGVHSFGTYFKLTMTTRR